MRKDRTRLCLFCESSFLYYDHRQKFCNHSCSVKHSNKEKGYGRKKCPICEKSISYRVSYCSFECSKEHKIWKWLAGLLDACSKYGLHKWAREFILSQAEFSCQRCGFDETRIDGTVVLQVHHIDGDWTNCEVDNLECLCPNCHALTDNFGAKNKGQGRSWKRPYNQKRLKIQRDSTLMVSDQSSKLAA